MGLTKPRASQILDLDYKQATRVITVADVTLSSGAPSVVDGVSLNAGDRVLVTGQSTGSQNGIYVVTVVGVGADGTWVRTNDANEDDEISGGMIIMVTEGSVYQDTQWKLTTNDPIELGVTSLTFVINILSSVGGANTQVQINDAGTLGGFSNLVFDKITNVLSVTGNVAGTYILGDGSQLTGLPAGYADSDVAAYLAGGTVSTDIKTTAAISATGTVTGLSFVGVATSAQYADLAENYLADSSYNAGTVVEFGGNAEVTISSTSHSTAVAGIVSTEPAYLMNSHLAGEHVVAVALTGRVPCVVQGPVKKGTVLVAGTIPGTAMAIDNSIFQPGCVVGKAMELIDSVDVKTIEVAVGRL